MNSRIVVTWPKSQELMEHARFKECDLINDEKGLKKYGSSAYYVPKDIYETVFHNHSAQRID